MEHGTISDVLKTLKTYQWKYTEMKSLVYTSVQIEPPTQMSNIHTLTHFGNTEKHTNTNTLSQTHTHTVQPCDDSAMTPTTSLSFFTPLLSSFSQPSSLAVHITLQDSRGERNWGRRRAEGGWRGKG